MGSTEQLPDGWIRKESTSRPNNFYYFNTKTGTTQWVKPNSDDKSKTSKIEKKKIEESRSRETTTKLVKLNVSSKGHSEVRFKINDKSKDVNKKGKSNTPAQDRIQKLVHKNELVAKSLKDILFKSSDKTPTKTNKSSVGNISAKKPQTVTKSTKHQVDFKKCAELKNNKPIDNKELIQKHAVDESPALFTPKNIAKERLQKLQHELISNQSLNHSANDEDFVMDLPSNVVNVCDTMKANRETSPMDEEMEWEPCDNSIYSFQQFDSMAVDVLMDSAYIIPDTNVFIDSLTSIKSVAEKDHNFSILIPFVVLQELDKLKHRKEESLVSSQASRAIRYIYEQLKSANKRVQGQKATEDKAHIIDISSPDDKILNCCLQIKGQSKEVILVTNDINLSNKALLSDIEAITSKQCSTRF